MPNMDKEQMQLELLQSMTNQLKAQQERMEEMQHDMKELEPARYVSRSVRATRGFVGYWLKVAGEVVLPKEEVKRKPLAIEEDK